MSLVDRRPDVFNYYIIVEFECGSYYAIEKKDPKERVKAIEEDARRNFCECQILNITVVEIPKRIIKNYKNKLYSLYCGCCAFGA